MRYRKLGRTGLVVSEIGLGGGGIGHVWGETTEEEIAETIALALSEGVNFYDVAPSYGNGLAEEHLGRALADAAGGVGAQMLVATKISLTAEDLDDIPSAVERGLTQSLERLRRDRVDLFQLHNGISAERGRYPRSVSTTDVLGERGALSALSRVREMGLTRFVGITGMGEASAVRDVLTEGASRGQIDTVQAYYNLLNVSAAEALPAGSSLHDHGQILPLAASLGLGVIGIRNLSGGALSGGVDRAVAEDSLVARDHVRARTLSFLESEDSPLSRVAARFVLEREEIATVVPGVKNREELRDQLAAMDLPSLTASQSERLSALRADDFGVRQEGGRYL